MRGIGAAARRGAHLPASYAAAFSSFSGIGGGGSGGGAGCGRGSGPSPFGQQPRAPGRPTPDDEGADPFSAPSSVGRGRGETAIPSFSAFSGAGRGRGSPLPPPPTAEDASKHHITKPLEETSPTSDPERPSPGASFSALPRPNSSVGAGRGVPRFQQPPTDNAPEENRFIRRREEKQAAASSSAPSTQPKLSAEDAVKRALELLGGGKGAGGGGEGAVEVGFVAAVVVAEVAAVGGFAGTRTVCVMRGTTST
ncbi:hypothetical protein PR202_gb28140 [Eleusine coracana subsp. coracana]|uniref:Uncharacterized protein n=1 Tax=Eleusine coracana subsp. coracana TaxID=191504 RepID=A0AAV5FY32_ELECO|nr:hypothetical protein PR202_gb28140 [Eleusine coracana subsp. coracana]